MNRRRWDERGNLISIDAGMPPAALADRPQVSGGTAVTLAEAAALLGITAEHAGRMLAERSVARHVCFARAEVERLAAERRAEA
jgi:hypothetical protein